MTDKKIDFELNKAELEKMKKVSELIQEVKPYYLEQRKKQQKAFKNIKVACITLALMFFGFGGVLVNQEYDIVNSIVYHNITAQELGFPTDEYGLITVY